MGLCFFFLLFRNSEPSGRVLEDFRFNLDVNGRHFERSDASPRA